MLRTAIAALLAVSALVPAALADGGPSPGVLEGGAGVLGAGGAVRYVTVPAARSTLLEAVRSRDGRVLRWRELPAGVGIPLVAYDGTAGGLARSSRVLVLADSFVAPPPRAESTFRIVDPRTFGYETISLKGDFAFDALSPNGRLLYLIQHVSRTDRSRYLVRAYDLERRRLLPRAVADRTQRGWVMQGSPVARTASASGRFVYTLYQNPGGYPFVHALDTARGVAHCIGLPWTGDQSLFTAMRLALADGGRTLEAAVPWPRGDRPATLPSFRIDTRTYRLLPPRAPGGFPWWTLSLAALLSPAAGAIALRRRRASATPRAAAPAGRAPTRAAPAR
ncbi:MAG TPA: hypothetical protein VFB42_07570 [Gaiellaceae bacterium]|nr:hypothetical protein [Gaiellaceae bacterium]